MSMRFLLHCTFAAQQSWNTSRIRHGSYQTLQHGTQIHPLVKVFYAGRCLDASSRTGQCLQSNF